MTSKRKINSLKEETNFYSGKQTDRQTDRYETHNLALAEIDSVVVVVVVGKSNSILCAA